MEHTRAGRPGRTFEAWTLAAATNLDHTLSAPRAEEPGSASEAIALLLSPRLLGPNPPHGFPGCYAIANDPSGEILGALYDAAFAPEVDSPDPAFRVYATVDHEAGEDPSLEVAGVLVGGRKDRLIFSEPGLPLPEITCSDPADLKRLHARILSADLRV